MAISYENDDSPMDLELPVFSDTAIWYMFTLNMMICSLMNSRDSCGPLPAIRSKYL